MCIVVDPTTLASGDALTATYDLSTIHTPWIMQKIMLVTSGNPRLLKAKNHLMASTPVYRPFHAPRMMYPRVMGRNTAPVDLVHLVIPTLPLIPSDPTVPTSTGCPMSHRKILNASVLV